MAYVSLPPSYSLSTAVRKFSTSFTQGKFESSLKPTTLLRHSRMLLAGIHSAEGGMKRLL